MKENWMNNPAVEKNLKAAWKAVEDLGNQFKRNVDIRMKRGDVRAAIIRLLKESPMHGYQIIHEIEKRSDGAWKPSPGSIYPTLQLLSDEGLVKSEEADGRRTYSLTKEGEEVANSEAESPAPWETEIDLSHNPRAQLASIGMKVAKSAAMLAQRANEEQIAKAVSILEDTARALTALIKQD